MACPPPGPWVFRSATFSGSRNSWGTITRSPPSSGRPTCSKPECSPPTSMNPTRSPSRRWIAGARFRQLGNLRHRLLRALRPHSPLAWARVEVGLKYASRLRWGYLGTRRLIALLWALAHAASSSPRAPDARFLRGLELIEAACDGRAPLRPESRQYGASRHRQTQSRPAAGGSRGRPPSRRRLRAGPALGGKERAARASADPPANLPPKDGQMIEIPLRSARVSCRIHGSPRKAEGLFDLASPPMCHPR